MNQSLITMIRREEERMQKTETEEASTATMQPKVILSELPEKIASFYQKVNQLFSFIRYSRQDVCLLLCCVNRGKAYVGGEPLLINNFRVKTSQYVYNILIRDNIVSPHIYV
jgi:hypothetical protein